MATPRHLHASEGDGLCRPQSNGQHAMDRDYLTRDSVAAGDDFDAPHVRQLNVPACDTALALVEEILKEHYLPNITGGRATWVVSSHQPFAVCAQEWPRPKELGLPIPMTALATKGGDIRLHFSYIGQIEPKVVHDVLWRCTFDAASVD